MPFVQLLLPLLLSVGPLIQAGVDWPTIVGRGITFLLGVFSDDQKLAFEKLAFHTIGTWLRSWDGPSSGPVSTDEQRAIRASAIDALEKVHKPEPPRRGPYNPL